jgi:hypothetical protein
VAAVAAAVAVFIGIAAFHNTETEQHSDGQGPLASTGDPRHQETTAFDAVKGGPWTLGYQLCLHQGSDPAVIQSVGPVTTVGSGFRFLGASIRQFKPSPSHTPILSLSGYPPQLPDSLHPAVGFSVSNRCVAGGLPTTYTELLIGFDHGSGSTGGGWHGIKVGYSAGGRHFVVTLGYDIMVCGSAVTALPHLCPTGASTG